MNKGIPNDQGRYSEFHPVEVVDCWGEHLEGNQKWQDPNLRKKTDSESLVPLFRQPSPEEHLDDQKDARGDGEQVGLEGRESETSKGEGEVTGRWNLFHRDIRLTMMVGYVWVKLTMGICQTIPIR